MQLPKPNFEGRSGFVSQKGYISFRESLDGRGLLDWVRMGTHIAVKPMAKATSVVLREMLKMCWSFAVGLVGTHPSVSLGTSLCLMRP